MLYKCEFIITFIMIIIINMIELLKGYSVIPQKSSVYDMNQ